MSSSPPSSPLSSPPGSPAQQSDSEAGDDVLQPLPRARFSECAWLIDFVNRYYGPDEAKDWKMVTKEFNRHFRTNKSQRGVLVTYSNLLRKGKPRKKREREEEEEAEEAEEAKHEHGLRSTRRKKRKSEGGEEGEEGEGEDGEIDGVISTITSTTA